MSEVLSRWRGLFAYLALTFASSWVPALFLSNLWAYQDIPNPLRLLVASAIYAICMGWQPIAAVWIVRRWIDRNDIDDGLDGARPRFYALASLAPLALAGAAMAVALLFTSGSPMFSPTGPVVPPSLEVTVIFLTAMCGAASLLWIQALAEEIGWRGYFLARFMQQLGPWKGLGLHGAIWGLWYAPLFLVANGELGTSTIRSLTFVVTCMFLGALLGWLRLASGSVFTTTVANSLLTVTAGLPFLLNGEDPGVRGAAYGPAGWVPMSIAIIAILVTKFRNAVRVPEIVAPRGPQPLWFVVLPPEDASTRRTLH